MMDEKAKIKQELENDLKKVKDQQLTLNRELEDVIKQQENSYHATEIEEYKKAKEELLNHLDEKGKVVLEKRSSLEKKKKSRKLLAWAIVAAYVLLAAVVFYLLNMGWSSTALIVYAVVGLVAFLIYPVFITIANASIESEMRKTRSESCILEYDKKAKEIFNEYVEKGKKREMRCRELSVIKDDIGRKIAQTHKTENDILNEIHELDFNFAYPNTILFYGKQKGNRYGLYVDGALYDTVKGGRVVTIMLTEGLHSFKVDNTSYNIVDGSVDYSYEFNTMQFMVEEKPMAYPFICDFKTLKRVSGEEFQNFTKTRLI